MNIRFLGAALAVALFSAFASPALVHAMSGMAMPSSVVKIGDIEIGNGYSRATLPGAPVGAGFMTITNTGTTDDTLIAAASDIAGDVQLHNMRVENDVMKMYEMEGGIPIPAGQTVTLAPGGLHVMFMQMKGQLVEGEDVKVTLTFARAGTVDVVLAVRDVAAGNMGGMGATDAGAMK